METSTRQQISDLYLENWRSEKYVPIRELKQLLNESTVKQVLQESEIEPYQHPEIVRSVRSGGYRTFGILCIISRTSKIAEFVKRDGFLPIDLDSRLPYEEQVLKIIIPDDYRAFYDNQWAFSAPIFACNFQHRILHDKCILPFQEIEEKGEGGFGVISKVSLPGAHQAIASSSQRRVVIVRKEIKAIISTKNDTNEEQHILCLLQLLRHPNIIQFYTAFSIGGRSSLFFECADHDLTIFFQQERPSHFEDDELLNQLFGLASALDQIHNYFSEEYDLRLIGCHYDLTPKNILVKGHRLLLSDFGLSRLKSEAKGSDSMFKGGIGDYLAPECQSLQGDFLKHRIRRPSDIWSFGCILAEMTTYLARGPSGVTDFAAKREVKFAGFLTLHTFHQGDKPHNQVLSWLNELHKSSEAPDYTQELLTIVIEMIEFEAKKRLSASEVARRLFHLAQKRLLHRILGKFRLALPEEDTNLIIQCERLKIWAHHVGLNTIPERKDIAMFYELDTSLTLLEGETRREIGGPTSAFRCKALRTCIDKLWDILPQDKISPMYAELENLILTKMESKEDDLKSGDLRATTSSIPAAKRLQSLITTRQALISLNKFKMEDNSYYEETSTLHHLEHLGQRTLGYVESAKHGKQYTFTEYLQYQEDWIDKFELLITRVNTSVAILKKIEALKSLPVLQCLYFSHFPDRQAFGLVYRLPSGFSLDESGRGQQLPVTLMELIRKTSSRSKRPPLNRVFALAQTLAAAIVTLHKAGRFHKSISSYNVLFFPGTPESFGKAINEPFLVGFAQSREIDVDAFTVGPTQDPILADYQHPGYRIWDSETGFKAEHDFYSLGIVLLELGRWKPLRHMTKGKETLSPAALAKHLLLEEVPQVESYMGEMYRGIVTACLDGSVGN
ncbi:kinase-like protein, partial [Polyplosphaeria fusca]